MTVTPLHPAERVEPEGTDRAGLAMASTVPVVEAPAVTLVQVDPRELVFAENVRADLQLDKSFVGSVRDQGVLVPVVAYRVGDELRVLYGQRRTLAAVESGRPTVPVYVIDVPDEGAAREVSRIIDQLTENDQRLALRDSERVGAFRQLELLGLTATQIARRTHRKVGAVRTGLAVARSELAAAALGRYDLTVEQAAVLAEFDGDVEAVKALTVMAVKAPEQFAHEAQRLRTRRAEAAAREALIAELTAAGVAVVAERQFGDRTVAKLDHLLGPDGAGELTVEQHAGCPGHGAYLSDRGSWQGAPEIVAVYVCTDWRQHGHVERFATPIAGLGSGAGGAADGMSEEAKAGRRVVIANNKAWDAARPVRRKWLTAFLARKAAPKDGPQWVAGMLGAGSHELRRALEDGHSTAVQLLGLAGGDRAGAGRNSVVEAAGKASPARAGMLTLGLVLGALEGSLTRGSWRYATSSQQAYFRALRDWGYPLSEVEELVVQPDTDPEPPASAETAEDCADAEPRADEGTQVA